MRPAVEALVEKARRSLEAAERLLRDGDPDFATSRAYYAMFYLAEAMLLVEGQRFSKHSAVSAAFGYEFARTGRVDPKFHKYLLEGFTDRNLADYTTNISADEKTRECIEWAREFLAMAEDWLERNDLEDRGTA